MSLPGYLGSEVVAGGKSIWLARQASATARDNYGPED